MAGNWTDFETRELLSIRAETDICRQFSGTVKDALVYEKITGMLGLRGIIRQKGQIITKLRNLRKKFLQINESGNGRSTWTYFDICQSIWGNNSHCANPVASVDSLDDGPQTNGDTESTGESRTAIDDIVKVEVWDVIDNESPSPHPPPPKRSRKVSRRQLQMSSDLREVFREMDEDFHDKEDARIQEQRRYEERTRREMMAWQRDMQDSQNDLLRELLQRDATDWQRETMDRQRDMQERLRDMQEKLRDMQESQNNLLRELVSRMPLPTPPQQPLYSPYHPH